MPSEKSPISQSDFEKLFVNNPDLQAIQAYLSRFNPIDVMKMAGQEIRHSNILAWLLNPNETHGLGERFIKAFLGSALTGEHFKGGLSAMDIVQADLRDVEVRREWQNIDIFIHSRQNNFAFAIENKVHAKQHSGQLAKYIQKVKDAFATENDNLRIKGVFLTLHDEDAEDQTYAEIGYDAIAELIPRIMASSGASISRQVKTFIDHYVETLREMTGMSEQQKEMEKLAKSLYRQNQKLLDFIWEHGSSTEFNLALDDVLGADRDYGDVIKIGKQKVISFWNSDDTFSFLPEIWYKSLGEDKEKWGGCEKWWSGYPVICWIKMNRGEDNVGSLTLYAEVGPLSDHQQRKNLIETIQKHATSKSLKQVSFQKNASEAGRKYSKFLKNNQKKINDVQSIDDIEAAIKSLLEDFEPCFKELSIALKEFHDNVK